MKNSNANKIKKICIFTDRYPLPNYPANTFLEQLVKAFADNDVECDVVAPYAPFVDFLSGKSYNPPSYDKRITNANNEINVYCPTFFCPAGRKRFGVDFGMIYLKDYCRAAKKVLEKQDKEYDAFYAHFISPSALAAAELGRKYNKPVFFAYGESSFDIISKAYSLEYVRGQLKNVSGVVAVSSHNRTELIKQDVINEDKIKVFPNAVDSTAFFVMDKAAVRESLGIDKKAFVIVFVGHFNNRKGSLRVSAALSQLENVQSIFIGKGEEPPTCDGVLFCGQLPHDKIVAYLNAADVFVLPTLAEGCCNAIVEAMACGLPIISSNLPFNDDILTDENSIRVDPNDVDAITEAIKKLKDNPDLRKKMAESALEMAKSLTIQKRAENIMKFMNDMSK